MVLTTKGQRTERAIVDQTIEIIEQRGEAAVRVQDLAAETGVAVSSIYYFFKDREGLIAAAQVERYSRSLIETMAQFEGALSSAQSRDDLKKVVLGMNRLAWTDARAPFRLQRLNVVGSTMGRPWLKERIAAIQDEMVSVLVRHLNPAQEKGWIRTDVDPAALAAWMIGNILQRALIELGESQVKGKDWNKIAEEAVFVMLFDEKP